MQKCLPAMLMILEKSYHNGFPFALSGTTRKARSAVEAAAKQSQSVYVGLLRPDGLATLAPDLPSKSCVRCSAGVTETYIISGT
jgi:hypothetical protein